MPDGQTRRFPKRRNGSADWRELHWLGFISGATRETAFYLDNIVLGNSRARP